MLYMVDISVHAGEMELEDLWDLWEKEVAAARGAMGPARARIGACSRQQATR